MTISQAINTLISDSPFLEESLAMDLINISSLARIFKKDVERMTRKEVSESAIVMAIRRRPQHEYLKIAHKLSNFMSGLGDIIVRSGLSDFTFENSPGLNACQRQLIEVLSTQKDSFYTHSQGIYETTFIINSQYQKSIDDIFVEEKMLACKNNLSAITIKLPSHNTEVLGVYYYLLKKLAWAGINVCEIISTSNEVSFVVSENDVPRAFPLLMHIKKGSSGNKYKV